MSTVPCFLDFLWDADMTFQEIQQLDPAVLVDAKRGPRRVVLQALRGEIRYWLATERDPIAMSRSGEGELGAVGTSRDAAALCGEFLNGEAPIEDLKTTRISNGRRRP